METLNTAVVDITLLIATCRALRGSDAADVLQKRRRLRAETRRAAVAYLEVLARSKDGVFDHDALVACRIAAEQEMPRALDLAQDLASLLDGEAGVLGKLSAVRNDLWRLSHLAIHLRQGVTALKRGDVELHAQDHGKTTKRLQRRVRQALVAYARESMQGEDDIGESRRCALAALTPRCLEDAEQLARLEIEIAPPTPSIGLGVVRPLQNLLLDWAPDDLPTSPDSLLTPAETDRESTAPVDGGAN